MSALAAGTSQDQGRHRYRERLNRLLHTKLVVERQGDPGYTQREVVPGEGYRYDLSPELTEDLRGERRRAGVPVSFAYAYLEVGYL